MSKRWVPSLVTILLVCCTCSKHEVQAGVVASVAVSAPASPKKPALADMLPDKAGPFVATPLVVEPRFVRREYSEGETKISVTIANAGATPMSFEEWVKMSSTSPVVKLDAPAELAFGFYDCALPDAEAPCNVHIHFRAGYHLELMGEGKARRADFDVLLNNLPIRGLAERSP